MANILADMRRASSTDSEQTGWAPEAMCMSTNDWARE